MANSTVLQLVQSFCREYALPVPGALQGASDAGALQMRELLQTVGDYAWGMANWHQCVVLGSWTSVAGGNQGALNTLFTQDFAGIIPNTVWDLTEKRELKGPVPLPAWQAGMVMSGTGLPPFVYSVSGGMFLTSDGMPAGHPMLCYYKTRRWIVSGGVSAPRWTTDSDTSQFSDTVMKAGLRAFWLRAKQMPHRFEMEAFEDLALREASVSQFKAPLSLEGQDASGSLGLSISLWNTVP